MCAGRKLVRVGVVAGVVLGGALLIAGPARLHALWSQTTENINGVIDRQITDPVAVRAQLRTLEGQYPRRIAAVRSDLAELNGQVQNLKREEAVTARVVAMAEADFGAITALLDKADRASLIQAASDGRDAKAIEIAWQDKSLTIDEASRRAADIANTRDAYAGRLADIQRDAAYLGKQQERLAQLLAKLEREQADFQVQLWQLDRQVDSISRNERMIAVLKSREESIENASRYSVGSLEGLKGKLADIRARQEGELAALGAESQRSDYETKAKLELDRDMTRRGGQPAQPTKAREIIRITPETPSAEPSGGKAGSPPVASAGR